MTPVARAVEAYVIRCQLCFILCVQSELDVPQHKRRSAFRLRLKERPPETVMKIFSGTIFVDMAGMRHRVTVAHHRLLGLCMMDQIKSEVIGEANNCLVACLRTRSQIRRTGCRDYFAESAFADVNQLGRHFWWEGHFPAHHGRELMTYCGLAQNLLVRICHVL